MPLPDLTDAPRVQGYLRSGTGISNADVATIEDLILVASRLIRSTTNRRFGTREEGVSREILTYGSDTVYVDELMSKSDLTSVTDENGLVVPYEIDLDDFAGEPRGATLHIGAYSTMYDSRGLSGYAWPPDHADLFIRNLNIDGNLYGFGGIPRKLVVTGNFGWEIPPQDISFAATRAVALWFKEEIAHYGEDAFISRGQQFNPEELPPLTMAMLRGANWIVREGVPV